MNLEPLKKKIERSWKLRAPLYAELGVPMHEDVVWVGLKSFTEETRDTSPIVGEYDE